MTIDPILLTTATGLIEEALNKALFYSPGSEAPIQRLDGYAIDINAEPVRIRLLFSDGKLLIHQHNTDDALADAMISGSPLELLRLVLSKEKSLDLSASAITIRGDSDVIHQLYALALSLDVDYEAMLADVTGNVPAHLVGRGLRGLSKWTQSARRSMESNIEEYLQEEGRQVPARIETELLFDDIDELKLDVDRLEARINQLKSKQDLQTKHSQK